MSQLKQKGSSPFAGLLRLGDVFLTKLVTVGEWDALECFNPDDTCNGRWKCLSNEPHGLNVEKGHSLPSTVVSYCPERGPLRLGGKYLTGVHYTGGGEEVAKVTTRNLVQGLEGPSADLGNCMRYPQEALQEHD